MTATTQRIGLHIPEQPLPTGAGLDVRPRVVDAWIRGLPLGHTGETARRLYEVLQQSNRIRIDPVHRMYLLERTAEPIRDLRKHLTRHYLGRALPLADKELKVAALVRVFQVELALGYMSVVEDLAPVPAWRRGGAMVVATRGAVHALGQVLLTHWQLYVPAPRHVWWDLHQLYRYCEARGLLRQAGPVSGAELTIKQSVEDIYKRILLLWLADPFHWSQIELPMLYRGMSQWLGHVRIGPPVDFDESAAPAFAVGLHNDLPPTRVGSLKSPGPGCRLIDTAGLVRVLRVLLAGRDDVPGAAAGGAPRLPLCLCRRLLAALAPRSQRRVPRSRGGARQPSDAEAVLGLRRIHELVAGRVQSPGAAAGQPPPAELPLRPLLEMPELHYSQRTAPPWIRAAGDGRLVTFPVRLLEQGEAGCRLVWSKTEPAKVSVGELVCVRNHSADADWRLGVVRWIRQSGVAPVSGVQWLGCAVAAVRLRPAPSESDLEPELQPALMTQGACHVYKGDVLLAPRISFCSGMVATLVVGAERLTVSLQRTIEQADCYVVFEFSRCRGSAANEPAPDGKGDTLMQEDADDEFDALWGTL